MVINVNKDSKEFLQLFINDYIKKLTLLRHIFGINYLIILKYIEGPKKITLEKFNQCREFINKYNVYLNSCLNRNESFLRINDVMHIFELYFGGKHELKKFEDILKKIHEPYITKGLIKLNKNYPNFFPETMIPASISYYFIHVNIEFLFTDEYFYRLIYNNYNWSLYKIIYSSSSKMLFNNVAIKKIATVLNSSSKMLFNTVAIEKILVYFHSILRKP